MNIFGRGGSNPGSEAPSTGAGLLGALGLGDIAKAFQSGEVQRNFQSFVAAIVAIDQRTQRMEMKLDFLLRQSGVTPEDFTAFVNDRRTRNGSHPPASVAAIGRADTAGQGNPRATAAAPQ